MQKEVREQGDFLSTVFTRKKKNGNIRTILNLKCLNKHVTYNNFKMESTIQSDCWMTSVDLKDAFYSVPIHKDHQKYLKFKSLEKNYTFLGMSKRYSEAIRISTKILKPPFSVLRKQGSRLLMTHIYKVQQKSSVIKTLMQQ